MMYVHKDIDPATQHLWAPYGKVQLVMGTGLVKGRCPVLWLIAVLG